MTRGGQTYSTELLIVPDTRVSHTAEDCKLQFDAVMRVYNLLGDMSYDVDRINAARDAFLDRAAKLKAEDPLRQHLQDLAARTDEIRRKIVATREGGAITGEERIREKTAKLYGYLNEYEGRPGDYQISRIDSLTRELGDVAKEFDAFTSRELPGVNKSLAKKGLAAIPLLSRADWDKANSASDSGS